MALDSLSCSMSVGCSFTANKNVTGSDYTPFQGSGTPKKQINFTLAGGATANAINEIYSAITTIAASGNTNIDLTALLDAARTSGVSLVRVKGLIIRLLSTTDDATNGTNCSSITVGNAAANPFPMFLTVATTTFNLLNGDALGYMTPSAAGIAVSGTAKLIKIVNNDASNSAAVQLTILGSDT